MISGLVPRMIGPGTSLGWEHCIVFLGNSHGASLHPGV